MMPRASSWKPPKKMIVSIVAAKPGMKAAG